MHLFHQQMDLDYSRKKRFLLIFIPKESTTAMIESSKCLLVVAD
jgi:hypothetical protein